MTLPENDDQTPAVVLQEPERAQPAPQNRAWQDRFVLRPEEDRPSGLHPDWQTVLAEGETVLWQGAPSASPLPTAGKLPLLMIGFAGLVVLLNSGFGAPALPFVLVVSYLFFRHKWRHAKASAPRDRRYLLTTRAAYLARDDGQTLRDIEAFPITSTMRLGLGPRSLSFTTRRDANGKIEAEGFLDISDARQVHDLIRDVQKGMA